MEGTPEEAMRAALPRCRMRAGMLRLACQLAEGPWRSPVPLASGGAALPASLSYVWPLLLESRGEPLHRLRELRSSRHPLWE